MAAQTNGTNRVPADASEDAPRKLKILMLHGTSSYPICKAYITAPVEIVLTSL